MENKNFKLTNLDINENYKDYKFHLSMNNFRGAMAYWLASQVIRQDIDIDRPLNAFTEYLRRKHFKTSDDIVLFTFNQLLHLITEDVFIAIPEIYELNLIRGDFYDLGALSRNVLYMICRERICEGL